MMCNINKLYEFYGDDHHKQYYVDYFNTFYFNISSCDIKILSFN